MRTSDFVSRDAGYLDVVAGAWEPTLRCALIAEEAPLFFVAGAAADTPGPKRTATFDLHSESKQPGERQEGFARLASLYQETDKQMNAPGLG